MVTDAPRTPLLSLLRQGSPKFTLELVVILVVAGLANALLLVIINFAALNASNAMANGQLFWTFVVVIVLFVVTERHVLATSITEVERLLHEIRVRLSERIRKADLLALEGIGRAEIYASVNRETLTISQGVATLVIAIQSAVMVFFSVIYLAWLSRTAFILTALLTWLGLQVHFRRSAEYNRLLEEATERENGFFDVFTQLLDGFKEVKMNQGRAADLFDHLTDVSGSASALKMRSGEAFAEHFIFAQVAFYALIGGIVFVLPRVSPTYSAVVIQATAAVLFIIGPLSGLVGAIPLWARANVAARNIETLDQRLMAAAALEATAAPERTNGRFESLALRGVMFRYPVESGMGFSVGPIDLTIQSGEMLFIVGGNGSGKSTFLKVLTGLYHPMSGTIAMDRTVLTPADAPWYRSHFSTIFSDYHLFDRLYGLRDTDPARVEELLRLMRLDQKTRYEDGKFTTQDLSGGQKKRLALVVSLLENRPVLVFDEVAADQDPEFRRFFYEELLADLKRQGKTVIAATHDDRYFAVADRVVKMDYGQLVSGAGA